MDKDGNNDAERHSNHELLVRVDERMMAVKDRVERMEALLNAYVTRVEFTPVKLIAFGLAGLVLSTVIAALVAGALK